jgi:hypothetical protein
LSETDLTAINHCRGDHNRLGYALMRCYLRHPGRAMRIDERPPAALLAFVAEQIDVLPASIDTYLVEKRTRERHALECQERLCAALRHHARRGAHRRLTNGLSAEQRKRLDALTQRREEGVADLVEPYAGSRQTRGYAWRDRAAGESA